MHDLCFVAPSQWENRIIPSLLHHHHHHHHPALTHTQLYLFKGGLLSTQGSASYSHMFTSGSRQVPRQSSNCWLPSSSTAAAEKSGRRLFPDCYAVFKIFVTQLFMFANHHIFPYCRGTALHVRTVKLALQPFQLETTQVRSWRSFSWSVIINYIHKFISVYKFYISGVYPHLNQRSEARGCYSL